MRILQRHAIAGALLLAGCAEQPVAPSLIDSQQPMLAASTAGDAVLNPGSGHRYELVHVSPALNWEAAREAAEQRGGHLATITSAAENEFVRNLIGGATVWLGGFQAQGSSEPSGGWTWVTGEPWTYSNWAVGEPNNWVGYPENHLIMYAGSGTWNDRVGDSLWPLSAYVVEYSTTAVRIDVRPGSTENPINRRAKGSIPVALLSTRKSEGEISDFDAATADVATIEFGPGGAREIHGRGHLEDADGDGDLDIVLHFEVQAAQLQDGATEACMTGSAAGQAFKGCDTVRLLN